MNSLKKMVAKWLGKGFSRKPESLLQRSRVRPVLEDLESRQLLSVAYHGGPLLQHVEVETVYYGSQWSTNPMPPGGVGPLQPPPIDRYGAEFDQFFTDISDSTYVTMLEQYNAGGQTITGGSFTGRDVTSDNLGASVDDTAILNMLVREMNQHTLPLPDGNRLYVVLTPPNVTVTSHGQTSGQQFLGYHGSFGLSNGQTGYYAVLPFGPAVGLNPAVTPIANLSPDAQVIEVASHELAEAITDPSFNGWYDNNLGASNGEIGDLANQNYGTYHGYSVQREWSNADNRAVLPGDTATVANAVFGSAEYLGDLVTGFYKNILHRTQAPTQAEVNGWISAIQQNHLTDEQVIADFLTSAEFAQQFGGYVPPGSQPTYQQDLQWVTGVYQTVLNRTPSAAEDANWANQAQMHGRNAVAYTIARTQEAEADMVNSYYVQYLHRSILSSQGVITDSGAAQFISNLVSGYVTREQVQAGIIGSQEYFADQGRTNEAYLIGLYRDALNRAPDAYGASVYLTYLRNGGG